MATRILVIEDNPANLELMAYLLRAFGYTPLIRPETAARACDAVAARSPT